MSGQNNKTIGILGCGWLGLPLAKHLVELGFQVRGSTTQNIKLSTIEQTGTQAFIVHCEEDACSGLAPFLTGLSTLIINLPPGLRSNPNGRFDLVLQQIQKEIIACGVEEVVFISSTSVYGQSCRLIKEETPTGAVTESGKQLVSCEQLLLKSTAFNTSIIRFGGLVGPNRHPVFSLAKRPQIDNPEGEINFIHLDDCIKMITRCVQSFKGNSLYNGVSPYHPSRKEYYTEMAKKAGIQLPSFTKQKGVSRIISSKKAENDLKMRFIVENLLTL